MEERAPTDFEAIRKQLGVRTQELFATMLGLSGPRYRKLIHKTAPERSSEAVERLAQAYLDGYRPKDWPTF